MNIVADFKTDDGIHIICKRPSNDDITDEQRQKQQDDFVITAYKILLKCKERLINEGKQDELSQFGLDEI